MRLILLVLCLALSGCASTVAGGAKGKIDWCIDIKLAEANLLSGCINAERTDVDE